MMQISVKQLKTLVRRVLKEGVQSELPKGWYHLSKNDLGDEFEFTPRQTLSPYVGQDGAIIEDDFTLRTSWAPSVKDAIKALQDMHGKDRTLFVYYTKTLPGKIDLEKKMEKCPASPGNEYGEDFSSKKWRDWLDDNGDPKMIKKARTTAPNTKFRVPVAFKSCVPDANETGEAWATKPLLAKRLGAVTNGMFYASDSTDDGIKV